MTAPHDPRIRPTLSLWATRVLRHAYRGQVPATVLERALRMLATADGHLDTEGNLKTTPGGWATGRRP